VAKTFGADVILNKALAPADIAAAIADLLSAQKAASRQ
jgi:hypothetical protein